MILKVISYYTNVQSVGPYNLTLSRPAVTSYHESSCRARAGKKTDVVSFLADSEDEQDGAEPANRP